MNLTASVRNLEQAHWGVILSRAAFVFGPLLGYTLVELMNYNAPWTDFTVVQVVLNLAWYYLLASAVYLAVGRLTLSTGISAVLFLLIGLANRYIIRFRGRTIFPGDLFTLRTAANVAGGYDYTPDPLQIACIIAMAVFCLLLLLLPKRRGRQLPRLKIILPTAAVGLLYIALFFATDMLPALGIEPSMWTTRGNGFVLNFTICMKYSRTEKPDGYDGDALAATAHRTAPPGDGTKPTNLIVIMNESFSDLGQVAPLTTNEDWMPFYRSLTENTVKGTAYASVFGGTTANSEYEFLTGNTTAFLPEGTVPFHMYVTPKSPSLVEQMRALGYSAIAMHPYLSSGWNRVPVYRDFGFERVLFQRDFQNPTMMRDYITDLSNYENLIRIYEEKQAGAPLFVFNVTMQNHSAYSVPWKGLSKTVWLTETLEGKYPTVDQYLSLMKESDDALKYLVDYFSAVTEPTMICLFGDHQPQVATNFYTDALGGKWESLPTATQQKRQQVPFMIWANYDIPEAEGLTLSLNYLAPLLVETANLPQTGYQAFLSELRKTVPAVNAVGVMDTDGTWKDKKTDLSETAQTALNTYEQFQYNQLFDGQNLVPNFFTLPAPQDKAP